MRDRTHKCIYSMSVLFLLLSPPPPPSSLMLVLLMLFLLLPLSLCADRSLSWKFNFDSNSRARTYSLFDWLAGLFAFLLLLTEDAQTHTNRASNLWNTCISWIPRVKLYGVRTKHKLYEPILLTFCYSVSPSHCLFVVAVGAAAAASPHRLFRTLHQPTTTIFY